MGVACEEGDNGFGLIGMTDKFSSADVEVADVAAILGRG